MLPDSVITDLVNRVVAQIDVQSLTEEDLIVLRSAYLPAEATKPRDTADKKYQAKRSLLTKNGF